MTAFRSSADNPGSVNDHIFGMYRPLLNEEGRVRLCAILDWHNSGKTTPTAILCTLDQCDRLLNPAQPLTNAFIKARAALRRACVEETGRESRAAQQRRPLSDAL